MINFSAELYRAITLLAQSTPEWVHSFADFGTDAGVSVFAALLAWNGRHSRVPLGTARGQAGRSSEGRATSTGGALVGVLKG